MQRLKVLIQRIKPIQRLYNAKGEYEKAINMYETSLKYFSEHEKMEIANTYHNLECSLWEVMRRKEAILGVPCN